MSIKQMEFEDYIRANARHIDWTIICRHYNMSEELIDEFCSKVDWDELDWNLISGVQQTFDKIKIEDVPAPFINEYIEILQEINIEDKRSTIINFLRAYSMYSPADIGLYYKTVLDEFLEKYKQFID